MKKLFNETTTIKLLKNKRWIWILKSISWNWLVNSEKLWTKHYKWDAYSQYIVTLFKFQILKFNSVTLQRYYSNYSCFSFIFSLFENGMGIRKGHIRISGPTKKKIIIIIIKTTHTYIILSYLQEFNLLKAWTPSNKSLSICCNNNHQ